MTEQQLAVLSELRSQGYCVITWTPEEIGEADIRDLEDLVISRGNDYLEEMSPTSQYLVSWSMGIVARSPKEAAQHALRIMRDPESIATVFDVAEYGGGAGVRIDLWEGSE